eukprot:NODE_1172_length_2578_cov_7.370461.p1 GENE.NODE_1172_length_2578_cov_7.370461~~NODE_1172_length_2578_cov_7.370461.p1  ORF type:complete len:778 (-),score=225.84 NODE_1172_length_2578_cov_7.370461:245-2341(-)
MCFTSLVLLKLDLYVAKAHIRFLKHAVFLGPGFVSLAMLLYVLNRDAVQGGGSEAALPIPPSLVRAALLIGTIAHIAFEVMFLNDARPSDGAAQLPTMFRCVRFLDVFGWYDEDGAFQRVAPPHVPNEDVTGLDEQEEAACRQATHLAKVIQKFLEPGIADQLSAEQLEGLKSVGDDLASHLAMFAEDESDQALQRQRASVPDAMWMRCERDVDFGASVTYYVKADTGEVRLDAPPDGEIVTIPTIVDAMTALQEWVPNIDDLPDLDEFEPEHSNEGPFMPATRRPGSMRGTGALPWKYFAQLYTLVLVIWCIVLIWFAFVEEGFTPPLLAAPSPLPGAAAPSSLGSPSTVAWPHRFFSPHALACAADDAGNANALLVIGDSEDDAALAYFAELPLEPDFAALSWRPLTLQLSSSPAALTKPLQESVRDSHSGRQAGHHSGGGDLAVGFQSLAAVRAGPDGHSLLLLLLDRSGRTVAEHAWPATASQDEQSNLLKEHVAMERVESEAAVRRQWVVGAGIRASLRTITAAPYAARACAELGAVARAAAAAHGWALYGATELGEVVALCPVALGRLVPAQTVARVPLGASGVARREVIGMHAEANGVLWLLTMEPHSSRAELLAIDVAGATTLTPVVAGSAAWPLDAAPRGGAWPLPTGRHWATGLCGLGANSSGLLAGATPTSASPELWRLRPTADWIL